MEVTKDPHFLHGFHTSIRFSVVTGTQRPSNEKLYGSSCLCGMSSDIVSYHDIRILIALISCAHMISYLVYRKIYVYFPVRGN